MKKEKKERERKAHAQISIAKLQKNDGSSLTHNISVTSIAKNLGHRRRYSFLVSLHPSLSLSSVIRVVVYLTHECE
jgi:hypothetical protein